jgi:hypothetical protein
LGAWGKASVRCMMATALRVAACVQQKTMALLPTLT